MSVLLAGLTVWPVKSMGGGTARAQVLAGPDGLAGDREHGVSDGHGSGPVSARTLPGLLRWAAAPGEHEPLVTAPDGRQRTWSDPELAGALSADLGRTLVPVSPAGGCHDLPRSVLVTTTATHAAVEQAFGARLEHQRWRTNVLLDGVPAFDEHGWEGARLRLGEVVLRLLHPCQRCTVPTYAPGGLAREPALLRHLAAGPHAGPFGINARVETPGLLRVGDPVDLEQR